jgi:NAD(P)-dependent dehydrogenase (short-subunit alcohol dehydrogenase family)
VSDRKAFERAADEAEAAFGKIHLLCNNAGIDGAGPLKDASFDDWDWHRNVLLDGVFNGVRTMLPRIRSHGEGGHIVNTASMAGMFAAHGAGVYTTMKYAVVGMSESLRRELAEERIGISVFMPGGVRSNIGMSYKHRPANHKTGFETLDSQRDARAAQPAPPTTAQDLRMDPNEAARRVLCGVRRNDLFIFSHVEFREAVEARMQALLRAFPIEPLNQAKLEFLRRAGSMKGLQSFYEEQTTPRGAPDEHGEESGNSGR